MTTTFDSLSAGDLIDGLGLDPGFWTLKPR